MTDSIPQNGQDDLSSSSLLDQSISSQVASRHHHPDRPFHRTPFETGIVWSIELALTMMGYYVFAKGSRAVNYLTVYIRNPQELLDHFYLSFWFSLLWVLVLAKLFHPTAVILGGMSMEFFLEWSQSTNVQLVLIIYIGWAIFVESRFSYNGGEYYQASKIWKQLGLSLSLIVVYLPILYVSIRFQPPFPADTTARLYLLLNFFIQNLFLVIPLWFIFWGLDRFLLPFFPLSPEEQAEFDKLEIDDEERALYDMVPKPGEAFIPFIAHHPVEDDDHTFILPVGKVRVYVCTRCSAMILGVGITTFVTALIIDVGRFIPSPFAFWVGSLLPLVAMIDWGLQALHIRKATTLSRVITGFCLGAAMQILTYAQDYFYPILVVVSGYLLAFLILTIIRQKKRSADFPANLLSPLSKSK
ncbi:MAG: DUF2085 domain-containing protein [Promethearchaeota archaeon]